MRSVVLIRHGRPVIDRDIAATDWLLDDRALHDVMRVARALKAIPNGRLFTSDEPKAKATADVIAGVLDAEATVDSGFAEQGLGTVPFLDDEELFRIAVQRQFQFPDKLVLGRETSNAATDRWLATLEKYAHLRGVPMVVTHGRVMTGVIRRLADVEPVPFWQALTLPDAWLLDPATKTLKRLGVEASVS